MSDCHEMRIKQCAFFPTEVALDKTIPRDATKILGLKVSKERHLSSVLLHK